MTTNRHPRPREEREEGISERDERHIFLSAQNRATPITHKSLFHPTWAGLVFLSFHWSIRVPVIQGYHLGNRVRV